MARPKKDIKTEHVEGLARVGCTVEEMANILDCSKRTLETRYCAVIEKGRSQLRMSLRRKQVELANAGNPTMLVWLGKQLLGQSDKTENKHEVSGAWFGYVDSDEPVPPVPAATARSTASDTE